MYLIDYRPIRINERVEPPYISFNKIVGVDTIAEYREKFGEYIYYGYGFTYQEREDGFFVVKFATKREYPIAAIKAAITLDNSIVWYAMEENGVYVSKFNWDDCFQERIALLGDNLYDWGCFFQELEESLDDSDHLVWYFLSEKSVAWKPLSAQMQLPRFYNEL